jgi:mono/diheme cytochrome c family protein
MTMAVEGADVAEDAEGEGAGTMTKRIAMLFILLSAVACGAPPTTEPVEGPSGASEGFAQVKPLFQKNCVSCHSGYANEQTLRASGALGQLQRGAMPPSGRIDPSEKASMIAFLKG